MHSQTYANTCFQIDLEVIWLLEVTKPYSKEIKVLTQATPQIYYQNNTT